jgi:hypothetical protein
MRRFSAAASRSKGALSMRIVTRAISRSSAMRG